MKRILSLLVVFSVGLIIFGLISNHAGASNSIFSNGSQDELETAKQISLGHFARTSRAARDRRRQRF